MIEFFVGLFFMFLFSPRSEPDGASSNDETIRPILLDNFHKGDHTNDPQGDDGDFVDF